MLGSTDWIPRMGCGEFAYTARGVPTWNEATLDDDTDPPGIPPCLMLKNLVPGWTNAQTIIFVFGMEGKRTTPPTLELAPAASWKCDPPAASRTG